MEDVKISVIIPVYNTSMYLEQCLNSVVNQTLKSIEIICIDDGSTDNSLEILQRYQAQDNRIKVFQQKHKKQGAARNLGIQQASGEYIGFVDSDDWCELDMFEKMYNRAFETNSDITMCALTTFNENKNNEYSRHNTYANLDIFPKTLLDNVFSPEETLDFFINISGYPVNKIFKREFLKTNKFLFKENMYFEDGIFVMDTWLKAKRISLIKHFGYYYRMHSETSTCFSNDFNKLDSIRSFKYKKQALVKNGVYEKLAKDFEFYKKRSMLFWFDKITDNKAKVVFYLFMLLQMPSCALEPLQKLKRELSFYFNLLACRNKKLVFWGASIFLEQFIAKYHIKNKNILGIIDKNPNKHNTQIGTYMCYPPEKLEMLNPDKLIITIINFSKNNQESIKEFLVESKLSNIELECI